MNQPFYTGKGIGVAILDTGIYPHIDFDNRICAFADFISNKKMDMERVWPGFLPEAALRRWENIKVRLQAAILWR